MIDTINKQHRAILQRIAHRVMLEKGLFPDFSHENDELEALAKHCTEKEDAAKKVERHVKKSAAAILLESKIGERFDAIVTGASDKGTWVRLLHPPIEGRLESGLPRSRPWLKKRRIKA